MMLVCYYSCLYVAKMSSIRSPIDLFENYQNDTIEELTIPSHMTFVVGSEQEPNTSYLPKVNDDDDRIYMSH